MHQSSTDRFDSDMPDGAAFHESIASGWSAGYVRSGFKRRLSCFRSVLDRNVTINQSWLDLGCGSGVLTKELLDRGALVVAVDASPGMLKEANTYVGAKRVPPPTWIRCDVQKLTELADCEFDGVLCSSVVEYVDNPDALLIEAARVLRPSGRLVISLPPTWSAIRTVQKVVRRVALRFRRDRYRYLAVSRFEVVPSELREWLYDFGFTLESVTSFDPVLPRIIRSLLRPSLLIVEARRNIAR